MHEQGERATSSTATGSLRRQVAGEAWYARAPVGCASVLDDGTILDSNDTLALMLHTPRDEVVGTSLLAYLEAGDRIPVLQSLAGVTSAPGDAPLEVRLLRRGETSRNCLLSASRQEHDGCIDVALTDETGRREVEGSALQAQKMDAIGRMAGGIAHDLNNLLTVVSVHDDLLLTALDPDDPKREDLLAIQNAIRKATAITKRLMAFARPQVFDSRRTAVNGLVSDVVRELGPGLRDGVALGCRLAQTSADVAIDPEQLVQVLRQLVKNSEDAIPSEGRIDLETISVELGAQQLLAYPGVAPGRFVRMCVTDTGIGMDPPTLSHAFEPYFTTKPRGEGRGLGLATVYAVARQHGGFVEARSHLGAGTSIDFFLPEMKPEEPPFISAPIPMAVEAGKTILVADDEPAIRTAIQRMLSKQGYICHAAADGEEALGILDRLEGRVDLVLTDVVMPKCTGPELVRRMRVRYPAIPAVLMTGYASTEEMEQAHLPEISAVLHKPFAPHALQSLVRQAIDGAERA